MPVFGRRPRFGARKTRRRPAAWAVGAGAVAALSLPPWGWWPLGVAGLAVAAAVLERAGDARASTASRALAGLCFGLGMFLPGLWWVTEFHAVGYVALTLLQTSFFVAAFALCRRWWSFPGAVVLAEAARSAVPFGGLPLGGLALGQAGGPFVASARVGGALLVLGVVAALATALAAAPAWRSRPRRVVPALVAVAITAIGWAAPGGRAVEAGGRFEAALVQGGGPRGFRATETDAGDVFDRHVRASERLPSAGLDLVLWPENAVDVPSLHGSAEADELAAIARRTGATVVAGVTEDSAHDPERFVNVAVVWSPRGEVTGRYVKTHRVPFGEYVPGRALFERLVDLSVLPRDAVAGTRDGVVLTRAGRMAVAISYEVFFADRSRSGVRAGGVALLVPTNAASFGTSQVPTQEVAAARLRAWETGRWVLQAAPTGYTAAIDHRGRVVERSTLGRAEIVRATVERRAGLTWYARFGDAPVVLVALVLLALPWLTLARQGRPGLALAQRRRRGMRGFRR
jgi:apolipoprotein N-acyltransferase